MLINRTNYEPFLIDYLEGNLSADACAAVEAFLLVNPDIQAEFDDLSSAVLNKEDMVFDMKSALKIDDGLSNLTLLMLQSLDNTIDKCGLAELEQALLKPEIAEEYRLLKHTVLQAETIPMEFFGHLHWPESLSKEQESELLDLEKQVRLEASSITLASKSELRYDEQWRNGSVAYLAVACAEGDMDSSTDLLEAYPTLPDDIAYFEKLRLKPTGEQFEGKSALLKKEAVVIYFTPRLKQLAAVAAAILLCFGLWQPWVSVTPDQSGTAQQSTEPKAPSTITSEEPRSFLASEQAASDTVDQVNQPMSKPKKIERPRVESRDVAELEIHRGDIQESKQEEIVQLPQEEAMAQEETQAPTIEPYKPIAKEVAMTNRNQAEPITLLAFIGDKIENRIEQSPVYTFIDRKKKEIFEAQDQKEPLRYERVSSADGVRQKLVLWGLEFQRSRRNR